MPIRTDQSLNNGAVDFLTDLSKNIASYDSESQKTIKDLCKSILGSTDQTLPIKFTYKAITNFFNELNQDMKNLTPDKQKKIKDLCKMVIGPGLTDSQIGTTEDMDAAPKFSRSTSNEDLTQTKLIRVGIDASLKMLDNSARAAAPEDRQKLRQELKKRAQQIKQEELERSRQPHFEQKITEQDFAALKSAEALIPERLKKLNDKIIELTGNIARCTVNVKNGKDLDAAHDYLATSYGEALNVTQSMIHELDEFTSTLNDISQKTVTMTESALSQIESKKQSLLIESNSLAVERSNLIVQKKANKTLSYYERGTMLGKLSKEFPSVTGPNLSPQAIPYTVSNDNLSVHFDALQNALSSSEEMITGSLLKAMRRLVGDRHMLNDLLGETRGFSDEIVATEDRYPEAQSELQAMVNGLECFVVPLKAYKESVQADHKRRNAVLAQQKTTLHNTFSDLHKAAVELKKLMPECTTELKTL